MYSMALLTWSLLTLALVVVVHLWGRFAEGVDEGSLEVLYTIISLALGMTVVSNSSEPPDWVYGMGLVTIPVAIYYGIHSRMETK